MPISAAKTQNSNWAVAGLSRLIPNEIANTMASGARMNEAFKLPCLKSSAMVAKSVYFFDRKTDPCSEWEVTQLVTGQVRCQVTGRNPTARSPRTSLGERSRAMEAITLAIATASSRPRPNWLEVNPAAFEGQFKAMPSREELNEPAIREQYVVEYYSR